MRLSREDYDYAVAASKPSAMTLRLSEKLFSKEVLLRSTLYGTKEFSGLDQTKISALKFMLMKVCYFTSMKCVMLSNQIVFMLFCFCFAFIICMLY